MKFLSLLIEASLTELLTWTKRLQEPSPPGPARCASCRLDRVKGSDGLNISSVVTCRWDLQHWDDRALIQQTVRCHDFSVALLTAAHPGLKFTGSGNIFIHYVQHLK